MKNFDYDLYKSLKNGESTNEWVEMCHRCYREYVLCKPNISNQFIKMYELGFLHDSEIKNINFSFSPKGVLNISMVLNSPQSSYSTRFIVRYCNVKSFNVDRNNKESDICSNVRLKECILYDEFYRKSNGSKNIVHEFFTDLDSFFCIEFEKITLEKTNIIFIRK